MAQMREVDLGKPQKRTDGIASKRKTTMHEFIVAAAIAAFAIFCVVMALAPIICVKGKDGYEDIDLDRDDR